MKLSEIEKASGLWKTIESELKERLSSLREQNDRPLPQDKTDKLRGRIAEVKDMLNWMTVDPKIEE